MTEARNLSQEQLEQERKKIVESVRDDLQQKEYTMRRYVQEKDAEHKAQLDNAQRIEDEAEEKYFITPLVEADRLAAEKKYAQLRAEAEACRQRAESAAADARKGRELAEKLSEAQRKVDAYEAYLEPPSFQTHEENLAQRQRLLDQRRKEEEAAQRIRDEQNATRRRLDDEAAKRQRDEEAAQRRREDEDRRRRGR